MYITAYKSNGKYMYSTLLQSRFSNFLALLLRSAHTSSLLLGHKAPNMLQWLFSLNKWSALFMKKVLSQGSNFCPCNILHEPQLVWICASWTREKVDWIFTVASYAVLLLTASPQHKNNRHLSVCTSCPCNTHPTGCIWRALTLLHVPTCPMVYNVY